MTLFLPHRRKFAIFRDTWRICEGYVKKFLQTKFYLQIIPCCTWLKILVILSCTKTDIDLDATCWFFSDLTFNLYIQKKNWNAIQLTKGTINNHAPLPQLDLRHFYSWIWTPFNFFMSTNDQDVVTVGDQVCINQLYLLFHNYNIIRKRLIECYCFNTK